MANTLLNSKKIIDVVKYRWVWVSLSALLIIPGIVAMIYSMMTYPTHMPLRVGIDFTGGTIVQYSVDKAVDNAKMADIRTKLEKTGIKNPVIQVLTASAVGSKHNEFNNILSVRTQFASEKNDKAMANVSSVVMKDFPKAKLVQVSSVGPTLGAELFKNSMVALLLAFTAIVAYLGFRFRIEYGVIAILALVHDALFIVGAFSILGLLCGVQIDALFITAILTVIGFSVHDTIVVFDRVRENAKFLAKKATYGEIVNASVNQTLARSINTSLTTLITLAALYFFGGVTTKDFVLAMMLGIAIGTYSSIFFASMALAWYHEKVDKKA
ncbi:MAG: protein translocase subunit SecF [Candidatus Gastranaerophilales bacterium]|nr:protein translocase subunit SecF [Candidatus Gastranaerophilales bacterium]